MEQNYMDENILQNLIENGNTVPNTLANNMANNNMPDMANNNNMANNNMANNNMSNNNIEEPVTVGSNAVVDLLVNSGGSIENNNNLQPNNVQVVDLNNNIMNSGGDNMNGGDMNNNMADGNNMIDMNNMADGNNNLGTTEKDLHKINFTSKLSFYSFIAVAILSFIESLKCNDNKVRHCLNLITVAAVIMIIQYHKIIANTDNGNITVDRYISRMVISPLALLILLLIITKNTGTSLGIGSYIIILVLNYLTLGSAYLGIRGNLDKKKANIMSLIFLVILFVYIYITFMNGRNNLANSVIFGIIAVLWFVFTCIYREKDENKKFVYHNVLDLGGSFFGLFIWAYLSNIFLLK